ncbi:MAG: enoyl-CoA hydratase/isomerase family protein, partial [Candidatus Hydrogenedentes bacterium]|nr:enoyl-CoA hydratase/isomerase family protein [Candidatus Hydrogenedentota bacterium]
MSDVVSFSKQGSVGIVTIDSPPVNALSLAVRKGMVDGFTKAIDDADVKAIVLICAGRTFIAGADITEFGKPPQDPWLPEVLNQMENSPKPILAAVHGTALGGGLEVALTCHYRCGVASAKFGLPEVLLGLLPGAGGTQRLPRIVGAEKALDMITSGTPIGAKEAAELGLIEEVIEGDLLEGAVALAEKIIAEERPLNKVRDLNDKVTGVDAALFDKFRSKLAQRKRNFIAPQRCVDAVEAACTLPFDEGIKKEGQLFMELMTSDQSKAQRHIFFAERQAAKIPDVPKDTPVAKIERVGILGAGTMGGGIAMNFVNAGIPVTILETKQEFLDKGLEIIKGNYARTVSKGRLSEEDMEKRMALITMTLKYEDFADVDMVIEAVFEEMDIKKEVFAKLNDVCKPEAILATNTSTLDVDEIASATDRPEKVVGTHFFSPANVMKLLEVVRGAKTSKETLATTMAVTKAIRKVGVVVGVCDGFVGNRMIHGYGREATFLLEEGALPHQVDKAIYDFGMAMGPIAMGDMAGLDVGWRIRKRQGRPEGKRYSAIADKICEMGRYGQKTGSGYYQYEKGNRNPLPDP